MDVINKEKKSSKLKDKRSISNYISSMFDINKAAYWVSIVFGFVLFFNLTWSMVYYYNKYDKNSEGLIFLVFNFFGLVTVLYIFFVYLDKYKYEGLGKVYKYRLRDEEKAKKEIETFTKQRYAKKIINRMVEENDFLSLVKEGEKTALDYVSRVDKISDRYSGTAEDDKLKELAPVIYHYLKNPEKNLDGFTEEKMETLFSIERKMITERDVQVKVLPKINIKPRVDLGENTYFSIFEKIDEQNALTF